MRGSKRGVRAVARTGRESSHTGAWRGAFAARRRALRRSSCPGAGPSGRFRAKRRLSYSDTVLDQDRDKPRAEHPEGTGSGTASDRTTGAGKPPNAGGLLGRGLDVLGHSPTFGLRAGAVVSDHARGGPAAGEHDFGGGRTAGGQFGGQADAERMRRDAGGLGGDSFR